MNAEPEVDVEIKKEPQMPISTAKTIPLRVGEEVYLKGVRCRVSYMNTGKKRITLEELGNKRGIDPYLFNRSLQEQATLLQEQLAHIDKVIAEVKEKENLEEEVENGDEPVSESSVENG